MARESEPWPVCPSQRKFCSRLSSPLTSCPSFRSHMQICWIISLPPLHFSGQQCKRKAGEVDITGRATIDLLPNDSTNVCFLQKKNILTFSQSLILSILCMNAGLVIELHILFVCSTLVACCGNRRYATLSLLKCIGIDRITEPKFKLSLKYLISNSYDNASCNSILKLQFKIWFTKLDWPNYPKRIH